MVEGGTPKGTEACLDVSESRVPRGQKQREGGGGEIDVVEAAQLYLAIRPHPHHAPQRISRRLTCRPTHLHCRFKILAPKS